TSASGRKPSRTPPHSSASVTSSTVRKRITTSYSSRSAARSGPPPRPSVARKRKLLYDRECPGGDSGGNDPQQRLGPDLRAGRLVARHRGLRPRQRPADRDLPD